MSHVTGTPQAKTYHDCHLKSFSFQNRYTHRDWCILLLVEIDIQCCNVWDKIYYQFPCYKLGMITAFQQCNFSLEFPEILSQNHTCYHWLSVSGISKIMHCGILINMPYSILITEVCAVSYKKHNSDYEFMISLLWWILLATHCTN